MEVNLTDNAAANQYEVHIDNQKARIEYIKAQGNIYLTHTEVPVSLEGRGIGSAMVKSALKDVQAQGLTLVPLCPFVALYIKNHPEWRELVLRGVNIE